MSSASPFDSGLLSPATVGADAVVSDTAVIDALVEVERCYLAALVQAGVAPEGAVLGSVRLDPAAIAADSVGGGNPVIPLLAALRGMLDGETRSWLHRGATSQDIVDSALMLVAERARTIILADLGAVADSLAALAEEHRSTVAAARTLTQHSTPTTVGLRFANWLTGVLDARDALAAISLPAQLGGASGTLAALVQLSDLDRAAQVRAAFADGLGLDPAPAPWHTNRTPVTRLGDALVGVLDALGRIAANVATLSRTEIGELSEPVAEGRGGSSAMPQKQNPVLSVLIRSAALRGPGLASTLHVAAAGAVDERPDGAWHAEWPTLRELLRLALGASALGAELTAGLTVDANRVQSNLVLTGEDLMSERRAITGAAGGPADYLGAADALIDLALRRGEL